MSLPREEEEQKQKVIVLQKCGNNILRRPWEKNAKIITVRCPMHHKNYDCSNTYNVENFRIEENFLKNLLKDNNHYKKSCLRNRQIL